MISAHTKVAHVMYVKGRLVGVQALDLMNEEAGEKQIREETFEFVQIMRQEFI